MSSTPTEPTDEGGDAPRWAHPFDVEPVDVPAGQAAAGVGCCAPSSDSTAGADPGGHAPVEPAGDSAASPPAHIPGAAPSLP